MATPERKEKERKGQKILESVQKEVNYLKGVKMEESVSYPAFGDCDWHDSGSP